MKKCIRKALFGTLAVAMALIMASVGTVQVFAAGRNRDRSTEGQIASGKLYVKDVIIVTESEAANLDGTVYGDYVVLSKPISDFGGTRDNLFFAVLTTDDPNEAITDIKAMNMDGDYDFDAYANYLSGMEAWALAKADTTMTAVKEFRANYKAGKPSAVFAYNMLNYLVGDNEDVPLGEFFVNEAYDATLSLQLKNLVMKANLMMLTYIRQLLLVACSETLGSNDFVSELVKHDKANELFANDSYNQYRTAATDLMNSMGETRKALLSYRAALAEHGDGLDAYMEGRTKAVNTILDDADMLDTDEYKAAQEENSSLKEILSGKILASLFDGVYYIGYDLNKMSLTDILVKDPYAENEADRPTVDMLLPVVALMSDGQRGLAGCGFDKLVASVINDYSGSNSEYQNTIDEIYDLWGEVSVNSLVSIYSGVDLSLYDPNGIAMVGKDGEFLEKVEDDSFMVSIPDFAVGLMTGGAIVGIVGSCVVLSKSVQAISGVRAAVQTYTAATQTVSQLTERLSLLNARWAATWTQEYAITVNMLSEVAGTNARAATELGKLLNNFVGTRFNIVQQLTTEIEQAEMAALQAAGRAAQPVSGSAVFMAAFSSFVLVLSVALLIFSIVTIVMKVLHKEGPQDYKQVPRVLVTALEKEEYDERQQKMTSTQMIFYKGILDPFMSDQKAKDNQTPSKVMDVFDWSLTERNREWIALYTTTDGRVGHPIIYDGADNTLIILKKGSESYAAQEQKKGFNGRVNIFNREDYVECGDGVIVFNCDLDVTSETKTGLGASMIINSGSFLLFILLAVTVGAGIGVGCFLLVRQSRKKKENAVQTA